jgi:hypothetical protein
MNNLAQNLRQRPNDEHSTTIRRPRVAHRPLVVATLPYARVVQSAVDEWVVQTSQIRSPSDESAWTDVHRVRAGVFGKNPAMPMKLQRGWAQWRVTKQAAMDEAIACMTNASQFQSVFVPLVETARDLVVEHGSDLPFAKVAEFFDRARHELFALSDAVSAAWETRGANAAPYAYVKPEEHLIGLFAGLSKVAMASRPCDATS